MRLTSFTDYGLRMLMRMASAPDQAFSTAELAEEFRLSRNHLTKIMQQLARGGIVETRRGGGAVRGCVRTRPRCGLEMSCGCWSRVRTWSNASALQAATVPLLAAAA